MADGHTVDAEGLCKIADVIMGNDVAKIRDAAGKLRVAANTLLADWTGPAAKANIPLVYTLCNEMVKFQNALGLLAQAAAEAACIYVENEEQLHGEGLNVHRIPYDATTEATYTLNPTDVIHITGTSNVAITNLTTADAEFNDVVGTLTNHMETVKEKWANGGQERDNLIEACEKAAEVAKTTVAEHVNAVKKTIEAAIGTYGV